MRNYLHYMDSNGSGISLWSAFEGRCWKCTSIMDIIVNTTDSIIRTKGTMVDIVISSCIHKFIPRMLKKRDAVDNKLVYQILFAIFCQDKETYETSNIVLMKNVMK